jgi:hypothetical protein
MLQINLLRYTQTGDFAGLMPLFGQMSNSSSHPCLYCPLRRSAGVWEDKKVELKTFASSAVQLAGWRADGAVYKTKNTQKFQSTVGPVLVRGVGDRDDMTFLEKAPPPGVHLLLYTNDILRPHCNDLFGTEKNMLKILKERVGVIPHSYQGKDGTFEGPQCAKILNRLNRLEEFFINDEHPQGFLLYGLLETLKLVKDAAFGIELDPKFETIFARFKDLLLQAHEHAGLPITPKAHIVAEHVVQWCRETGCGLARANEAAVEAAHQVWWDTWEHYKVRAQYLIFNTENHWF